MISLLLFDSNKEIANAFTTHFADLPNVSIRHCLLEELNPDSYDCLVSPANSFGLMDGGIDRAITELFGNQLMKRVQKYIIRNYAGEQPVGTSFLIPIEDHQDDRICHYLSHTPTMRIPMDISDTDNVYVAMKTLLVQVIDFNMSCVFRKIRTIACSGLGTKTGRVSPDSAARQMRLAYGHIMNVPDKISWNFAIGRHREINESILGNEKERLEKPYSSYARLEYED